MVYEAHPAFSSAETGQFLVSEIRLGLRGDSFMNIYRTRSFSSFFMAHLIDFSSFFTSSNNSYKG